MGGASIASGPRLKFVVGLSSSGSGLAEVQTTWSDAVCASQRVLPVGRVALAALGGTWKSDEYVLLLKACWCVCRLMSLVLPQ